MIVIDVTNQQRLTNQAIQDIAHYLIKQDIQSLQPGLVSGLAGHILFLWYFRKVSQDAESEQALEQALDLLEKKTGMVLQDCSASYGVSGIAWLYELLLAEQDDGYTAEFNANTDRIIQQMLSVADWPGEIEYVLGLSGVSIYARRRMAQANKVELYATLVRHFSTLAQPVAEQQCCWPTPADSGYRFYPQSNEPELNLGLAHGIPSIIAALIPACQHPILATEARRLVLHGCNWLLAQRQAVAETGSYFGYLASTQRNSRLGWCYGDLAIALTLARAGIALDHAPFSEVAKEIALHAAGRDVASAQIRDAGLCHGSAGLMLMFSLLHRIFPEPKLLAAKLFWKNDTLTRYEQQGLEGFNAFRNTEQGAIYIPESGMLNGYAGIGLCLLAELEIEPYWADALLLT